MHKKLPVLHVGFHKSGSTTVQAALFARHPEIANLGEPHEDPDALAAMRNVWESCHRVPRKRAPFDLERSRASWHVALTRAGPPKVPVFSKETLTLYDSYDGPADRRIPERLKAVVGDARIIIIVRHQIRLIESLYLFHAKGIHYEPTEQWLVSRNGELKLYRYAAVARSFAETFGADRVALFMLEDLQSNPQNFATRMCEFIGVDPQIGAEVISNERRNSRVSGRYVTYAKLRKRMGLYVPIGQVVPPAVRETFNGFVRGGKEARVELPAAWVSEMESYFRDDNRRLAQEWGLPLAKYGYPL